MTRYIDKFTLVEEIKNRIKKIPKDETDVKFKAIYGNEAFVLTNLLSFIDTLEVKDVKEEPVSEDLEKEIELIKGDYEQVDVAWNNDFDFIARHFYELGLKTKKKE